MQASLLRDLGFNRPAMHARWNTLLHEQPVTSPLALPDVLVHLIDSTLDEIFAALATGTGLKAGSAPTAHCPAVCPCGHNPYLAYFCAAEQALREGLVLAQSAARGLDPAVRDSSLAELTAVLRRISHREIETFCSVCQYRAGALESGVQSIAVNRR